MDAFALSQEDKAGLIAPSEEDLGGLTQENDTSVVCRTGRMWDFEGDLGG